MTEKVLFVDDEANVLAAFKRTFRGEIDIVTATNAVEALSLVKSGENFAAVVSDMNMPGVSGLQLLQQFAKISPGTIRLILTGNADVSVVLKAMEKGEIFRYLTKPCSADRLREALRDALGEHRVNMTKMRTARHSEPPPLPEGAVHAVPDELLPGDILAAHAESVTRQIVLKQGTVLTADYIAGFKKLAALRELRLPLTVIKRRRG